LDLGYVLDSSTTAVYLSHFVDNSGLGPQLAAWMSSRGAFSSTASHFHTENTLQRPGSLAVHIISFAAGNSYPSLFGQIQWGSPPMIHALLPPLRHPPAILPAKPRSSRKVQGHVLQGPPPLEIP
jgi:hypothetical protein